MFFLVSFALVLVAVMLLVLGVLSSDGLTLIYASILCSIAAGIVLHLGTRSKAAKPAGAASPGGWTPPIAGEQTKVSSVATGISDTASLPVVDSDVEVEATTAALIKPAPTEPGEEPFFPIADYDDLTIAEILPLLKELYDDELEAVEAHERVMKERLAVLTAITDIRGRLANADGDITFSELTAMGASSFEGAPASLTVPSAWESDLVGSDDDFEDEEYEEVEYEEEEWQEGWEEPVEADQYEDLPVADITAMLGRLDEDELIRLRDVEESGRGRSTVLNAIDHELALFAPAPARKAPATKAVAKKAPARKAPATKAVAKKAPARKEPATKAVAKKAPARKAPATKAVATKAVAKKAVAKKAVATKAVATKAVATKAVAAKAVAKKAPARKAPATKAVTTKAPARKAPATKAVATKAPTRKAPATKAVAKKAPARKAPAKKVVAKKAVKKSGS